MRLNYISQIKSNLKKSATISTKRPTSNILDGSYVSVFKGRSLNFDDLREYVPGDDVKDIDWKATARSQQPLVREYIAEKKHNILFVLDTNKRMLGDTDALVEKKEYEPWLHSLISHSFNPEKQSNSLYKLFSESYIVSSLSGVCLLDDYFLSAYDIHALYRTCYTLALQVEHAMRRPPAVRQGQRFADAGWHTAEVKADASFG